MQPYDLIVIGSGPGGQRAAIQAAKAGKRVAIVEKRSDVGGVCINTGTIPSKTMREAVLHLSGFYYQNFYGANYHVKENVTMSDLNFRVQHVVENEVAVIQPASTQRGGTGPRNRAVHGAAHDSCAEQQRLRRVSGGLRGDCHGNETCTESEGSV